MTLNNGIAISFLCCAANAVHGADLSAIDRGLDHVRTAGQRWINNRGCVSCHQVPSMIWAHEAAQRSGFDVPAERLVVWKAWATDVVNFVKPAQKAECDREATMASNIDTMTAMLLAIPDDANAEKAKSGWRAEFAEKLVKEQGVDGSWQACGQLPMQRRPSLETQAITTLWSTLALLSEDVGFDKDAAIAFVDRVTEPTSVEWYAARLLVADLLGDEEAKVMRERLLELQNADGGWGWKVGENSDALGTGYALYALAKMNANDASLASACQFLERTQAKSGKWTVPGTKDSAQGKPTATANDWGTAWAVIALAEHEFQANRN